MTDHCPDKYIYLFFLNICNFINFFYIILFFFFSKTAIFARSFVARKKIGSNTQKKYKSRNSIKNRRKTRTKSKKKWFGARLTRYWNFVVCITCKKFCVLCIVWDMWMKYTTKWEWMRDRTILNDSLTGNIVCFCIGRLVHDEVQEFFFWR